VRELLARSADAVSFTVANLGPWMALNATLATIPALLAVLSFHRPRRRGIGWWVGVALLVLFLPNAPYVVTDLIHAQGIVGAYPGSRVGALVPLAGLGLLVAYGLTAYSVCLVELDRFLEREGRARARLPVRVVIHLLCAFGVVLGRIPRLHSWHVVTRPEAAIDGIVSVVHPLAVPLVVALAIGFAIGAAVLTAVARAVAQWLAATAAAVKRLVTGPPPRPVGALPAQAPATGTTSPAWGTVTSGDVGPSPRSSTR